MCQDRTQTGVKTGTGIARERAASECSNRAEQGRSADHAKTTMKTRLTAFGLMLLMMASVIGCAPHRRGPLPPVSTQKPPREKIVTPETRPSVKPEAKPGEYATPPDLALSFLGTPYVYGGQSPSGFDCSGLMWYVYGKFGVKLPRTARDQSRVGRRVELNMLRKGDLVFFTMDRDIISHVGMYLGAKKFVHAPGTGKFVRIDSLENTWWRKRVKIVRRVTG
jgi:cell wall-associated NlpC family hydrolase